MNFIDELAPFAVKHGIASGVLPSLIIAQGILESGSGTSELAVKANNLFGIKKGSGRTGQVYTKQTTEYRANGTPYQVPASFRKYSSYEGAVIDLCHKYMNGTGWEPFNRYAAVLNEKDYRKAAKSIYAAGYATDPKYPEKLISVIEQYNLTKYDKEVINVVKIFIDPGHGGTDPGAVGNGLKEKDLTLAISKRIESLLKDYEGVEVKLSRTSDQTLSLKQRTDAANTWEADYLMSVHINAGGGKGYKDYIFNGKVTNKTIDSQAVIHSEITKMIPEFLNQGKKRNNFHMVRESEMPAILTKIGFIDSPGDSRLLKSEEFLDRVALGYVNGIAKAFGLEKKEVNTSPKEVDELKFSSPSLKAETELTIGSKARREIIVKAAIKAGAHVSWADKLTNNTLTDADVMGLAVKYTVATNK